jgi:hypothetical protein
MRVRETTCGSNSRDLVGGLYMRNNYSPSPSIETPCLAVVSTSIQPDNKTEL